MSESEFPWKRDRLRRWLSPYSDLYKESKVVNVRLEGFGKNVRVEFRKEELRDDDGVLKVILRYSVKSTVLFATGYSPGYDWDYWRILIDKQEEEYYKHGIPPMRDITSGLWEDIFNTYIYKMSAAFGSEKGTSDAIMEKHTVGLRKVLNDLKDCPILAYHPLAHPPIFTYVRYKVIPGSNNNKFGFIAQPSWKEGLEWEFFPHTLSDDELHEEIIRIFRHLEDYPEYLLANL